MLGDEGRNNDVKCDVTSTGKRLNGSSGANGLVNKNNNTLDQRDAFLSKNVETDQSWRAVAATSAQLELELSRSCECRRHQDNDRQTCKIMNNQTWRSDNGAVHVGQMMRLGSRKRAVPTTSTTTSTVTKNDHDEQHHQCRSPSPPQGTGPSSSVGSLPTRKRTMKRSRLRTVDRFATFLGASLLGFGLVFLALQHSLHLQAMTSLKQGGNAIQSWRRNLRRNYLQHPFRVMVSTDSPAQVFIYSEYDSLHAKKTIKMGFPLLVASPMSLGREGRTEARTKDYGGLGLRFLQADIQRSDESASDEEEEQEGDDVFFGRDDDYIHGLAIAKDFEEDGDKKGGEGSRGSKGVINTGCRRTSKHRLLFPTCNRFHEVELVESGLTYFGHGDYRAAALIQNRFERNRESIVFKHIHYVDILDMNGLESTRKDSLIAERLTASPRIYDVHGLCGVSTLSEFLPYGDLYSVTMIEGDDDKSDDKEKDNKDAGKWIDESPLNVVAKLDFALQSAQAIADLHAIGSTHQDLKMDQFLFTSNEKKTIKLNDFNRAEMMLWNNEKQQYCAYKEDERRKWRSPEEFKDGMMNEKVDVFGYGNMLYVILTGKRISDDPRNADVKNGGPMFLPADFYHGGEALLVDLVHQCRAPKPKDRPSMAHVVQLLQEALVKARNADPETKS